MNFIEVLKECQQASGAGKKTIITSALSKADVDARRLIHYALNPYKVFGVKKFNRPTSYSLDPDFKRSKINEFILTLDKLDRREITGDAARQSVTDALSLFNEEHAKFMELVIGKDLQAGFSAETFTKIWKDKDEWYGTIPSFELMLADKCESVEEFEKHIKFPCIAQHKLDGCLSSSWTIQLKDGKIVTIGEFVDNDMEGEVLSYNVTTKKKEWKKIIAKVKNSMPERTYEWFQLTLEDGTILPPLTGNHRIWLPNLKCWRRVDELEINDVIFSLK